jgi:glycosyltransferase involved in cell wall biosynthesis
LICKDLPLEVHNRHFVAGYYNYSGVVRKQAARGACRPEFGFKSDDFVILVFALLRSWDEIQLIKAAFDRCRIDRKRLLMAGRFASAGTRITRKSRELRWRLWLWSRLAVVRDEYIPDDQLYRFFDTADVVIVPRINEIESGIPSLSLTFGTMVAAPSRGSYREHLEGTTNPLYEPGNPESLALALESVADQDRIKARSINQQKAYDWSWEQIVEQCLQTAAHRNNRQ